MFGLGAKTFLDRDTEDWCFETYGWLMRHLGGQGQLAQTALAIPSRDFIPPTDAVGVERAGHIFGHVKAAMGMEAWVCELVAEERAPQGHQVSAFTFVQNEGGAAGTFHVDGNIAVISYAYDLVDRPKELIAVFAHELAHYLLATIPEEPPGGHDLEELATDLAVAYSGFGIFGANAAFAFEQHGDSFSQGWASSRLGYLSERTWVFALAIFCALKGEHGAAAKWLKPNLAKMLAQAEAYLAKNPQRLAALAAIP